MTQRRLDKIIDIAILDYQSQSVRLVSCQVPIDDCNDERIEMELKALGYNIDFINYMYSDNMTLSDERGM
jgi:hypothetical protein